MGVIFIHVFVFIINYEIMKKIVLKIYSVFIIFLLVTIISSFSIDNINPKNRNEKLMGTWEFLVDNRPTGALKILGVAGEMSSLQMTPNGFIKTLEGTYEVLSDSVLIEKITKRVPTSLTEKEVIVNYKMDNENSLTIAFTLNGRKGVEVYRRVPFPISFKQ